MRHTPTASLVVGLPAGGLAAPTAAADLVYASDGSGVFGSKETGHPLIQGRIGKGRLPSSDDQGVVREAIPAPAYGSNQPRRQSPAG